MGKNDGLGRALIRKPKKGYGYRSDRHTTEYGLSGQQMSTRSVTEETSFAEFLNIAELANSDFTAQKKIFRFVSRAELSGVSSAAARSRSSHIQQIHKDRLKIPRRPKWTKEMSPDELDRLEKEEFLKWRRELVNLEQTDGITLTPFEKNLEFWRQLWRVVERSNVLVQIVDARQPLLYYCSDLETFVHETDPSKVCVVLVNKADFLSPPQRLAWQKYFISKGIRAVFWSATATSAGLKEQDDSNSLPPEEENSLEEQDDSSSLPPVEENSLEELEDSDSASDGESTVKEESGSETDILEYANGTGLGTLRNAGACENGMTESAAENGCAVTHEFDAPEEGENSLPSGEELLDFFINELPSKEGIALPKPLTIGFVGYPNVGKSSTLNALMGCKKTAVSATPGRTKHLQTLCIRDDLTLCDCPGLVMPSFVHSKADLVVAGILSIDEMRDCLYPIGIICEQIPRHVLEFMYGVDLSKPKVDGLTDNSQPYVEPPPTPHQLLAAHAYSHGFRTSKGNPHYDRSARLILKDFVQGRLLYCNPPPGIDSTTFQCLGRETSLLPPSLSHLDNAAKLSRYIKQATDGKHDHGKRQPRQSKLVQDFDRMVFDEKAKPSPHFRSHKRLLISREAITQALANKPADDIADGDDDTSSCISSSSSWSTVDSVGGSSLLSGTETLDTSTLSGSAASQKPWRIMSQSKGGGPMCTSQRGKKIKRKEKLRRVYVHLDKPTEDDM